MPVRDKKEVANDLQAVIYIHCFANDLSFFKSIRLSYKERRVDAWALRAEEGRDKLRKAAGRSKYPMSRGYPNGETHVGKPHVSIRQSITYGREPGELKHLSTRRKRK